MRTRSGRGLGEERFVRARGTEVVDWVGEWALRAPFHMGSFSGSGVRGVSCGGSLGCFFLVSPERREGVVLGGGSMRVYIPGS